MSNYIIKTNDQDELYHHGVLGMKWGIRRYQNEDGSLTSAGRKRKENELASISSKKRKDYKANPNKWVEQDMKNVKNILDTSSKMAGTTKNMINNSPKQKSKLNLDSMTDKQLRDRINRTLLEKQYNDMFAPKKTSRGKECVRKILDSAGTAMALGSSALSIAMSIRQLRG